MTEIHIKSKSTQDLDVGSNKTMRKIRSEGLQSDDLAKDAFDDMALLQNKNIDDQYISKVIHPFAVYSHSKQQFQVLETMTKRNKKTKKENVGFFDSTGNVVKLPVEKHPIFYSPLAVKVKSHEDNKNSTIFPLTECLNSRHKVLDVGG